MAWKTKPPYNITVNPAHPLASGLQGCWLFNEGEGLTANDISGNGNTGTLVGAPAWTTGNGGGNALSFDDSDYINCGGGSSLDITGDLTLETIMKIGTGSLVGGIIGTRTGKNDFTFPYELIMSNSDKPLLRAGNGSAIKTTTSGSALSVGTWYSIVGTISGTAMAEYVNGASYGTGTFTGTRQTLGTLTLGARDTAALSPLKGTISLIRIWNRALTAAEALALHNNPYDMFLDPQVNFLRGTATVTQGNTTAVVTHGLGFVPSLVWLQPLSDSGKKWFITGRTSTQFTINLPVAQEADVSFNYGVA